MAAEYVNDCQKQYLKGQFIHPSLKNKYLLNYFSSFCALSLNFSYKYYFLIIKAL